MVDLIKEITNNDLKRGNTEGVAVQSVEYKVLRTEYWVSNLKAAFFQAICEFFKNYCKKKLSMPFQTLKVSLSTIHYSLYNPSIPVTVVYLKDSFLSG